MKTSDLFILMARWRAELADLENELTSAKSRIAEIEQEVLSGIYAQEEDLIDPTTGRKNKDYTRFVFEKKLAERPDWVTLLLKQSSLEAEVRRLKARIEGGQPILDLVLRQWGQMVVDPPVVGAFLSYIEETNAEDNGD